MKAREELTIADPTPLRLRPIDLADPQALMIDVSESVRTLYEQLLYLRGLVTAPAADRERLLNRVQREAVEACDAVGSLQDDVERLAKRLRHLGRL